MQNRYTCYGAIEVVAIIIIIIIIFYYFIIIIIEIGWHSTKLLQKHYYFVTLCIFAALS